MKVALVNPAWSFERSIYFGCREPHLPLELGYARALLEAQGHETLMLDGQLDGLGNGDLAERIARFAPAMTVVATAPTYLFWRCAQPELRIPRLLLDALGRRGGLRVAIGPHGSATPSAALTKLGADIVVRGEAEEVVAHLADAAGDPSSAAAVAWRDESGRVVINGSPHASPFRHAPALRWPASWIARHSHHHHRFDRPAEGPGAEVEASRGCPYSCSFCAKNEFRDAYRRRDLAPLLEEIDGLAAQGVTYLYFIDEIFLPDRALLAALAERRLVFGVQTRIDLWKPDMIELLGRAGCVSIEAGVESLSAADRAALDKRCKLTTDELAERLAIARRVVPFVQANLIKMQGDDADEIARWRAKVQQAGVWANDPVPLFPYPSSPDYVRRWGPPDDLAWERAHAHHLREFARFSDIQEETPLPLDELEAACHAR